MNFIQESFCEKSGKPSNLRLISSAWVFGILFCIIYLVVKTTTFPTIPNEIILSIVGVLGAKAYQRGKEGQVVKPE